MKKRDDTITQDQVGILDNELLVTQTAVAEMDRLACEDSPSVEKSNLIARHKTIATNAAIRTVEQAMIVAGGQGYFKGMGLERRFRDVQACRYHPVQEPKQHCFSGRIALGLDPVD